MKLESLKALRRMASVFGKPVNEDWLQGYADTIGGESDDSITEAIKRLIATSKFCPKPSEVLAAIREVDYERRTSATRRRIDGQQTYKCGKCCDSGFVVVWHWRTVDAIEAGEDATRYTMAAACECPLGGDRIDSTSVRLGSDSRLIPVDECGSIEELHRILSDVRRLPNFAEEFVTP